MRDLPPVAHRVAMLALALGLLLVSFPLAVAAQDEGPVPVADVFEVTGDASEATVQYTWTITVPGEHWRLEAIGPEGEHVRLRLQDAEGRDLGGSSADTRAALFDLALAPGDYLVEILGANREGYIIDLQGSREPQRFDPEPNDGIDQAVPIADGVPVPGRLARVSSDRDQYLLSIAPGDEQLRDITLTTDSESDRQLCLLTMDNVTLQCRYASELPLLDLALDAGDYVIRIDGSVDEDEAYELLVDASRSRSADYELEPNDTFQTASPAEPALGVSGRSHYRDEDVHAFEIEGEAQLWRVEAAGAEIDYLRWLRAGNDVVSQSSPGCDGTPAALDDLFLVPGTHRFLVRACDGDYRLTATPMGLPDPEAEREPNSDDVRAEPYALGQRRVGRLPSLEDYDYFRFTLAAPELVELRLQQPRAADIRTTLSTGKTAVFRAQAMEPGGELSSLLFLQPGDYLLELRGLTPSDGQYELTTKPLDAWEVPPDAEPNDSPGFARTAPPSLRWSGSQSLRHDDRDAVWLPALGSAGQVRIAIDQERPTVRLYHGPNRDERVEIERQDDGSFVAAEAPTGVPLFLEIQADGDYEVVAEAPGWTAVTAADPLPVVLEVTTAVEQLAAYWPEGQRAEAAISLTNEGDQELELELHTRTSHYAWELLPEMETVTLGPGATATVPAVVETRADLWADAPVRLYATAVAADGSYTSGSSVLDAGRDAEAVGSHLAWPVPKELVGGLNVAGAALGGVPVDTVVPHRLPLLFDDVTPAGAGFGLGHDGSPLELIVDLAGEAPVPVAGTILNPLARASHFESVPRGFELALSSDGETWQTVLRDELTPLPIDQSFVLDEARDATHARLRIESTHGSNPTVRSVALGEWKVIAAPGATPDSMPDNIAEPVRGGHVARHAPFGGGLTSWAAMLNDDLKRRSHSRDREAGESMEIVVGFQEGRAAQVTGLRWHDPDGTDEETNADEVEVAVTTGGPLGPWRSVGTWTLQRAADGSIMPFDLDAPEWARYVRLTAPTPPEDVRAVEFPGKLEVLERPTDDEYRSILAEWGYTSDRGPFERLVPSVVSEVDLAADAGDTLATATPIASGETVLNRAEILEDLDWYRISVPEGQNTLTVELEGIPAVGVKLSLTDAEGTAQELQRTSPQQGVEVYQALVEAGDHYLLVEQPPFNVAFTFDTSGSMGPYLDFVLEGVRVFASDIEPGREVAMIFPVDRPPLLDTWQDQPIRLEAAVNDYTPQDESSNIEIGLLDSAAALGEREGTRAILAVADAETGSLDRANDVWSAFEDIEPRVYTVHVGAESQPEETRNLMRAWSDTNVGVYSYPTTHAEMERAFERMSTHLRRPSTYALTATSEFVDRRPAALAVVAPEGEPLGLAAGAGMALILDTSGSMNKKLDGERRIDIAKASMRGLVRDGLAEGVPVSLRVFGGKDKGTGCETRRVVDLGPLKRERTVKLLNKLKIRKKTGTPIAAALRAVKDDLAAVEGERLVVLITDGKATCAEDPEEALAELAEAGIEVSLNIVGFALGDEAVKEQMRTWAEANQGQFFDATDAAGLTEAVTAAVAAPVAIYRLGEDSEPLVMTTVGAPAVELAPGEYWLEVRTDPLQEVRDIVLAAGESLAYELAAPAEE